MAAEGLDKVEDVLARTADAVSRPAREIIELDPSWSRPGRHLEFAGEYWAFPLWLDGGTLNESTAREIGIAGQTIEKLAEYGKRWDAVFDARQNGMLDTWEECDEIGSALAQEVACHLDSDWTVHFLRQHDETRWAWAGGSGEQVYPS